MTMAMAMSTVCGTLVLAVYHNATLSRFIIYNLFLFHISWKAFRLSFKQRYVDYYGQPSITYRHFLAVAAIW